MKVRSFFAVVVTLALSFSATAVPRDEPMPGREPAAVGIYGGFCGAATDGERFLAAVADSRRYYPLTAGAVSTRVSNSSGPYGTCYGSFLDARGVVTPYNFRTYGFYRQTLWTGSYWLTIGSGGWIKVAPDGSPIATGKFAHGADAVAIGNGVVLVASLSPLRVYFYDMNLVPIGQALLDDPGTRLDLSAFVSAQWLGDRFVVLLSETFLYPTVPRNATLAAAFDPHGQLLWMKRSPLGALYLGEMASDGTKALFHYQTGDGGPLFYGLVDANGEMSEAFGLPAPPIGSSYPGGRLLWLGTEYDDVGPTTIRVAADGTFLGKTTIAGIPSGGLMRDVVSNGRDRLLLWTSPRGMQGWLFSKITDFDQGSPPGLAIGHAARPQELQAVAEDLPAPLVVWRESDISGPVAFSRLRGAHVGGSGNVLDADGITIAEPSCDAFVANAAANGRDALVVWRTANELSAARVGADGKVSAPMTLVSWPDAAKCATPVPLPDVASNGDGFFVVWRAIGADGKSSIRGARITADGVLLDPNGFVVSEGAASYEDPHVASDGKDYFVLTYESFLYGRRYSGDGIPIGQPIPLGPTRFDFLSWNGEHYLTLRAADANRWVASRYSRTGEAIDSVSLPAELNGKIAASRILCGKGRCAFALDQFPSATVHPLVAAVISDAPAGLTFSTSPLLDVDDVGSIRAVSRGVFLSGAASRFVYQRVAPELGDTVHVFLRTEGVGRVRAIR